MAAHIALPWIHRLLSNLKRWGLGVYHGLRKTNLQHYLDEFVFRFIGRTRRAKRSTPRPKISLAQLFPNAQLREQLDTSLRPARQPAADDRGLAAHPVGVGQLCEVCETRPAAPQQTLCRRCAFEDLLRRKRLARADEAFLTQARAAGGRF
jgi:hypothetical protein